MDGSCQFHALLSQIVHPPDYEANDLRLQIVDYVKNNKGHFKEVSFVNDICVYIYIEGGWIYINVFL